MTPDPHRRQVRVLIVDDSPAYAELVSTLLSADGRFTVVGSARDGIEGVERSLELRPDVVVMDIHMPRLDGIEATRRIRQELEETRVVIVTSSGSPTHRARAHWAGAALFLRKEQVDELIDGVSGEQPGERSLMRPRLLEARM